MFASTVLENAILHMEYFQIFDEINGHTFKYGKDNSDVSILKMYYWRSHLYWNHKLGYHPIFAVVAFIMHKWLLYGWNYVEILSGLFFRALYYKFKALYECAQAEALQPAASDLDINIVKVSASGQGLI